ncbi:unnamed protein product [Rotaria magnacalcarata]|uniref:Mitochondrial carrier protein n=1 Tax=Rotaria magnacalcarata TaxID=392030 RepID=A0A816KQC3_9BILA|nr:unnamed protein product [Rotaria magnacalcarata]CAF1654227.1 unnamed protein product [Rotaria magnacalcarata]CAF1925141.1 unnamed protein product [Rotaria magnacalcarata]CAF2091047.1 unnamed protein product [Rotaria magnacalcarata]CAF2259773.1 unnamed protein product [Rotaria magnacalcarata]
MIKEDSFARNSKQWNARTAGIVPHDNIYYGKCLIGGALACGSTHLLITPLDVTKCNMQVDPMKYRNLIGSLKTIIHEEGSRAIWKGWEPTVLGYSPQGALKFGLYEVFKDALSNLVGYENSQKYRELIWLTGAAASEFCGCLALCPMEMIKVKVQTSVPGTFPTALVPATIEMNINRNATRFPYGSIVPLWSRQIPYTVTKFYFFEKAVQLLYTHVFTEPKTSYSKTTQLGITFTAGYAAGIVCAIVSHPGDSIVSLMAKPNYRGKSIKEITRDFGLLNLCTKGLGTRIIMIGTIAALQWWIYDTFKTAMGMGTTGGK